MISASMMLSSSSPRNRDADDFDDDLDFDDGDFDDEYDFDDDDMVPRLVRSIL